ncbi:MAG: EamA family transporter [Nitrospirae bacterium]|nr:EamA family transporter [Nitrospirota bacterium]
MTWWFFAVTGALLTAVYYILIKRYLRDVDLHVLAGGVFLTTAMVLAVFSLIRGVPEIGPGFWPAAAVTVSLNIVAALLYFKALRMTDLSLSVPMLSFTPVFLIGTSLLILGEAPSSAGITGIFLIGAGSYVLNTGSRAGLLDPFRSILRNRGVLAMLGVAFLFSISSNFDKRVVLASDPFFGSAVVFLALGIFFLAEAWRRTPDLAAVCREHWRRFLLAGGAQALAAVAVNIAFTLQIVPYVISLKRLSIFFTVLFGGLFLREPEVVRRGIGAAIMLAGMILIVLS